MSRLSARYRHFWTPSSKTYQHFWANFTTASGDGNASGAILTVTTSLLTGEENVSEDSNLVAVAISIIPGSASTETFANGDLLTISTLITTGEEDVTEEANVVTVTTSLIEGTAGTAGSLTSVQLFLIAGTAFEEGAATGAGALLIVNIELIPGSVVSGANGGVLTVFTSLDVGAANGSQGVLEVAITLIPGGGFGNLERVAGGNPFVHVPVPPTVHARAEGAVMTARAYPPVGGNVIISDGVVEVIKYVEVVAPSIVVPGQTGATNVTATGHAVIQSLLVAAGQATGDAIAFGALLDAEYDYGPQNEMILRSMGMLV